SQTRTDCVRTFPSNSRNGTARALPLAAKATLTLDRAPATGSSKVSSVVAVSTRRTEFPVRSPQTKYLPSGAMARQDGVVSPPGGPPRRPSRRSSFPVAGSQKQTAFPAPERRVLPSLLKPRADTAVVWPPSGLRSLPDGTSQTHTACAFVPAARIRSPAKATEVGVQFGPRHSGRRSPVTASQS